MKSALLFFCTFIISVTGFSQKDSSGLRQLPFTSFNNPNVLKHIKEGRTLTLHLFTDSAGTHTYNGPIFVGDANSLLMVGGLEHYQGYSDAGFTYEERITTYTNDEITVIPHKEIEYISLQPRLRPLFSTLVIASLATVCIVTPVAITGYSPANFPSGEIVEVAAASLVVNVVLYKIFRVRKFKIKGSHTTHINTD
jgi:hypothetical protein